MLKSPPVRLDLFRFVTLRTPQQLTHPRRVTGFVFHPGFHRSEFMRGVREADGPTAIRAHLMSVRAALTPMKDYHEVRALDTGVYDFGAWLAKERNVLTRNTVESRIVGLRSLSNDLLDRLWDSLFYETLHPRNDNVRQACIRMLVASNFIDAFGRSDPEAIAREVIRGPRDPDAPTDERRMDLYLRLLANAKIVIPRHFTHPRTSRASLPRTTADERLSSHLKIAIIKHKVKAMRGLSDELATLAARHRRESKASLREARLSHEEKVAKAWDEAVKKQPRSAERRSGAEDEVALDFKAPAFTHEFPRLLSAEYRRSKLSPHAEMMIEELDIEHATLRATRDRLGRAIRDLEHGAYTGLRGSRKAPLVKGTPLMEDHEKPYRFSLAFEREPETRPGLAIHLSVGVGFKNAYFRRASYSVAVIGTNDAIQDDSIEVIDNTSRHLVVRLFPRKKVPPLRGFELRFLGSFELNNGVRLSMDVVGHADNTFAPGSASVLPADEPSTEPPDLHPYGVYRIGVADFRRVEQELCCYVPGEVSHIENIMAREYRERHTRRLTRREDTVESSAEREMENIADTSTTQRNEMQSEVSSVLESERSLDVGASAGVSAKVFDVNISAELHAGFASSNSTSTSNSIAKTYAEEVTRRAQEKVIQKTTEKRISRMLKEFEESNRHGFDNRQGNEHVTGIYRWIDKIYTNRLVNYGKRLMYEFMVPEPARWYRSALKEEAESNGTIPSVEVPDSPEELGLTSPEDLSEGNYQSFANAYGITVDAPPASAATLSESLIPPTPIDHPNDFSHSFTIYVPDGYEATSAEGSIDVTWRDNRAQLDDGRSRFRLTVGGDIYSYKLDYALYKTTYSDEDISFSWDDPVDTKVTVTIKGGQMFGYAVNLLVACDLKGKALAAWQNSVYQAIINAYQTKLKEYEGKVKAATEPEDGADSTIASTSGNRAVEQRELKRTCIEMLVRPFASVSGINLGEDHYATDESCTEQTIPYVRQGEAFERYASHVKFFEQAFEWEIISYLFYPYYWANKCKWRELLRLGTAGDPVFMAFLQSGMARVVVPVRPGFEEAVLFYMETGRIWTGGDLVLDGGDDLYLSILDELREIDGAVEEQWQTRIPSDLTIIQKDSALLAEGGLPCCDQALNEGETTNIVPSETKLERLSESPSEP